MLIFENAPVEESAAILLFTQVVGAIAERGTGSAVLEKMENGAAAETAFSGIPQRVQFFRFIQ